MVYPILETQLDDIIESNLPIYLAYSGGYDSTLILYELSKKLKCYGYNRTINLVTTVFHKDCMYQSPSQSGDLQAIDDIVEHLVKEFPTISYNKITVELNITKHSHANNNFDKGALVLQLIQMSPLLSAMPDNSILIEGYIRGDHAVSELESIHNLINCFNKLYLKNIKLYTPLYRYSKTDVLRMLLDSPVIDCCHTCDSLENQHMVGKVCSCNSCTKVSLSLIELVLREKNAIAAEKLKLWYGVDATKLLNTEQKEIEKEVHNE